MNGSIRYIKNGTKRTSGCECNLSCEAIAERVSAQDEDQVDRDRSTTLVFSHGLAVWGKTVSFLKWKEAVLGV